LTSAKETKDTSALARCLVLLSEIQAAIMAGDVKNVRHGADALKGAITSVLAKETFGTVSTLENTLQGADLARAEDACRRLREALSSLTPPTE
jgi:Hpt domain